MYTFSAMRIAGAVVSKLRKRAIVSEFDSH